MTFGISSRLVAEAMEWRGITDALKVKSTLVMMALSAVGFYDVTYSAGTCSSVTLVVIILFLSIHLLNVPKQICVPFR